MIIVVVLVLHDSLFDFCLCKCSPFFLSFWFANSRGIHSRRVIFLFRDLQGSQVVCLRCKLRGSRDYAPTCTTLFISQYLSLRRSISSQSCTLPSLSVPHAWIGSYPLDRDGVADSPCLHRSSLTTILVEGLAEDFPTLLLSVAPKSSRSSRDCPDNCLKRVEL